MIYEGQETLPGVATKQRSSESTEVKIIYNTPEIDEMEAERAKRSAGSDLYEVLSRIQTTLGISI
jgi:hypothetical protein